MHVPTKMDCVCGGLYRAVVGSLNKQLLDQLPPASSTAVASGSVLFCFSFFFLPAKASCFLDGWILCHGLGCLRDVKGPPPCSQPGSLGCGLSAWQAWAARQRSSSHFLIFPLLPQQQWPVSPCLNALVLLPPGPGAGSCNQAFFPALMCLSLAVLTLLVIPVTVNSTTSRGEVLCLLMSRHS